MKKLFFAGFVATAAMTALMYAAPMMGMPKMDIATMLGTMFLASPGPAFWLGMIIHLMMGTVLFPAVYRIALQPGTGSGTGKGVLFGLLLWAAANLMVMPMMGAIHPMVKSGMMRAPGFLMLNLGVMVPVGSLIGHLLYGALLGKFAGTKASSLQVRGA
ncbi:MAG: hypothetical protein HY237_14855 [Acidobacteria bacterium]|nr:hypothetical protein [Acidobacteriota bacterium]